MSAQFTTRPLMATMGWMAKAFDHGLRVTHRATRFGRIEYIVKDGPAYVRLVQAQESQMRGVVDEPTLGQQILLKRLAGIGVIELASERPLLQVFPGHSRRRRAG